MVRRFGHKGYDGNRILRIEDQRGHRTNAAIQSGVRKVRNHFYPRELHEIYLWTYARGRTTDYAVDVYDVHGTTELTSQRLGTITRMEHFF